MNLPRRRISAQPRVTLIVPVRNEERFIVQFLEGLCAQDYPLDLLEILIADGQSTDRTVELANGFRDRLRGLTVRANPAKEKAPALNDCIPLATGELILIMDCHSRYPTNYVSGLIRCLDEMDADYVGGRVVTAPGADTFVAKIIALALAHPFGVGGGTYRTSEKSGEGLAPFGCYRRELPFAVGGYNERLPRTHDDEFIARIARYGGKTWVCGDICTTYYPRATLGGLCGQMFGNGENHVATFLELPGHFYLRHYVPFGFVTALIVAGVLACLCPWGWLALAAVLTPYLLADLVSAVQASRREGLRYLVPMALLFPLIHMVYGLGTWWGVVAFGVFKRHRAAGKRTGAELISNSGASA